MTTGGGYGFRLDAERVEPSGDPAWLAASRPLKAQFWAEAGRFAARTWDASRAKGLDRHGRPLAPISPMTRAARRDDINPFTGKPPYSPMGRARASAPPLTPVGPKSRTRSLLRWRPEPGKGVWFTWIYDRNTRHYWGEILARHGRGFVQRFRSGFRFVPPRDVLGFSDSELAAIRDHMARWWAARQPRAVDRPRERIAAAARRTGTGGWDYGTAPTVIDAGVRVATARPGQGEIIWRSGLRQWTGRPITPPTPPAPVAVTVPVLPAIRRAPVARITLPPVTVTGKVAKALGRAPSQDDWLELALMARQAETVEQALRLANATTGEESARWRAVAVLIRAQWQYLRRRAS